MGGDFGGQWIHVYIRLSPFADNLKLLQHCLLMGHTPIQSKKLKKKKKLRKIKTGPPGYRQGSDGPCHLASQRQVPELPSSEHPGFGSSFLSQLFGETIEMTTGHIKCLQHV